MRRTIGFLFAVAVSMASAVAGLLIGDPFIAWGLGYVAGVVLVLANVLTHPMIFGWRQ